MGIYLIVYVNWIFLSNDFFPPIFLFSKGIDEVDTTPEIRTIELTNDGNGLGFGIVGVHNTGIVVKTIVKDGVAARVSEYLV